MANDDLNVQSEYLSDLVEEETNKRVKDIDKLSASISKMERYNKKYTPNQMQKDIGSIQSSVMDVQDDIYDMREDIDELNTEGIEEIEKTTNTVLSKIGYTIDSLAKGVTRITKNTALATKDAISQYGRAISEDISFNKQNVIAMSLARSTPLFGYFASKFMETDVFKNAYSNIKEKLGDAVTTGWGKIKSFFKRKPKEISAEESIGYKAMKAAEESEMEYADIEGGAEKTIEERAEKTISKKEKQDTEIEKKALESVSEKAEKVKKEAPKLQVGGYVEKEGLTRVHAAEVVLPIEKVLHEIDKASGSKEIIAKMGKNISLMSEVMAGTERYLSEVHHERKSLIESFLDNYKRVGRTESWQDKMLRATLDLQAGLVGSISRMKVAWERTLLENPNMRAMIAFGTAIKNSFYGTLRFFFRARGGYLADVRRATRSSNVFENVVGVLGLIYVNTMTRLDNISKYTKELAEYTTGKVISPVQHKTWTMFEKIKGYMEGTNEKVNMIDLLAKELRLDRDAMEKANITSMGSFLHPGKILETMGITKESVAEKFPMTTKIPFLGLGKKGKTTEENVSSMASDIKEFKEQSKKSSKISIQLDKEKLNTMNKTKKGTESVGEKVGGLTSHMKKAGKGLWKWLVIGFTMIKDTFSFVGGKIILLLGVAATALKWLAAKSGIGALASKGFGAATTGMSAMGGKLAGLGAGIGTLGSVAGIGGAIWSIADLIKGVGKGKEWFGEKAGIKEKALSGVGAMLGGTEEGFSLKGTAKGMAKGGMVGAGIGTLVAGPIGTVIGGAIGTIAGGLLGFLGGKNIAKALNVALKGLKLMAKGIWKLIKFPFIAMGWLAKKALKGLWWTTKKMAKGGWWTTKKIMKGVWKVVSFPATIMKWMMNDVTDAVKAILPDKIKEKIKVVTDSVLNIFVWIFDLFDKAKNWIKEKILGIPMVGKVLSWMGVGKSKETIPEKAKMVTESETQLSLFERLKNQLSIDAFKLVEPPGRLKDSANALSRNIFLLEKEGLITRLGNKWYSANEARNISNNKTIEEKASEISSTNIPSAQDGGLITRGGKINVHAGEIIGPIERVGDVINKTNLANMTMAGDLIKEKARMDSEDNIRKELRDNVKNGSRNMSNMLMNVTNVMSNSLRSVNSGTNMNGAQSDKSYGTDYVSMIVNGNIE